MKLFILNILISASTFCSAQNILFSEKELYPEGIAYSKKNQTFYVSSLQYGKIGKVSMDGTYQDFITDNNLVSSIGIHINPKENALYVCVSDPGVAVNTDASTQKKLAKVIAYDIKSGKQKFVANLGALNVGGANFANDLDFDKKGNAYVTNSFSPIIYKINKKGKASVFASNSTWKQEGFSLNGIVVHPSGNLIVVQSNTGKLFKINLKNPTQISTITAPIIASGDGLILNKTKNELVVISNSENKVYQLLLNSDCTAASLLNTKSTSMSFPTTGTLVGEKYYILNAKLNELFDPNAKKTSDFLIEAIIF